MVKDNRSRATQTEMMYDLIIQSKLNFFTFLSNFMRVRHYVIWHLIMRGLKNR